MFNPIHTLIFILGFICFMLGLSSDITVNGNISIVANFILITLGVVSMAYTTL